MPNFERLTRAAFRTLPVGGRIAEHGIYYKKLPNGDGRFGIQLRIDGQKVNRVLGKESEGVTRGDAEALIERLKTESREHRLKLPKGRKLEMSFKEAAQKYLEKLRVTGGNDLVTKEEHLRLHLIPAFGTKALSQITAFDLERYTHNRHKDGAAAGSINRGLTVLSHLINKAVEWGWIDKPPFKIKKLPDTAKKEVYLTPDECDRVLKAAKTSNRELYLFFKLGITSGMRMNEIFSIEIENIDLSRRCIYLPKTKTIPRHQRISAEMVSYLEYYLKQYCSANQQWLFPSSEAKCGHRTTITKSFNTALKMAGIKKAVNRHSLRHTAISLLIQSGADLRTVMEISGHKSLRMLQRYAHHSDENVQAAMASVEAGIKKAHQQRFGT
jgi:integrase